MYSSKSNLQAYIIFSKEKEYKFYTVDIVVLARLCITMNKPWVHNMR